mgnify:CR=1 FL=1
MYPLCPALWAEQSGCISSLVRRMHNFGNPSPVTAVGLEAGLHTS